MAGCADFRDYCDAQLIASRNGYLARTAWNERGGSLCEDRKHQKDFHDGFYEGYLSVASGQGGVAPLVAPSKYWGACYQDADGREIVNDWFAGFNEGAFAASQDGVGVISEVPTWVGGACCDEHGRIMARNEPPGPRKPRRGDPPVRAHLPPPLPKSEKPKNSEGNNDPAHIETPAPSDPDALEKMLLDPNAPKPDAPPADKSAPKKDEGKRKIKTASRTPSKAKIPERKTDADRWAKEQSPKREPVTASTESATPPSATPVAGKGWVTSPARASVPVNPLARPKPAEATIPYPVAPPVISAPSLKSAATLLQETPKPTRTLDDPDLAPPPPAKPNAIATKDATAKLVQPPAKREATASPQESPSAKVEWPIAKAASPTSTAELQPANARSPSPRLGSLTTNSDLPLAKPESPSAKADLPPTNAELPAAKPDAPTAKRLQRPRSIEYSAAKFDYLPPATDSSPSRSAIETVSHSEEVQQKPPPFRPAAKPLPTAKPKPDADWEAGHVPKAVEDGWGTLHDVPGADAAGRNK